MSLRRKAHECVEFVKRKFISLLTWKTKGQSHDMAKKEDVAKLGPSVELKVFLRYLLLNESVRRKARRNQTRLAYDRK